MSKLEELEKLSKSEGVSASLRAHNITVQNIDLLEPHENDKWRIKVLNTGREYGLTEDSLDMLGRKIGELTYGDRELSDHEKGRCEHAALALLDRALRPEAFRGKGR